MSHKLLLSAAGSLLAAFIMSSPAHALTMKECSTKYQAAKADGSAKDVKWNDFRAKFCGADAAAADKADEADVTATSDKEPAKPTTAAPKSVKFPKAIDKKYSSETPGKARLHLRRLLPCSQGCWDARRSKVDSERRRLLEPVQYEHQGCRLIEPWIGLQGT